MTPHARAAPLILAGLALLSLVIGMCVGAWRTGQIDPLHWLWPALATLAVMTGYLHRIGAKQSASLVILSPALLVAPPLAFSFNAGSFFPLGHALALVLLVAVVSLVARASFRRRTIAMASAIMIAGATPTLLHWVEGPGVRHDRPTKILSGVPLVGADVRQAQGELGQSLASVGDRAPFWHALAARRTLVPIDALEPSALSDARSLLLVQPRLLQPRELVMLDAWVRAGGDALILADPFLLWPDARSLGHPRRPPVTSLLDPLFTHWGLRLEATDMTTDRPVLERRLLRDGTLLNLAGASSFARVPGGTADCRLNEGDLIASCRVGRGQAALVADADFIEAELWTLAPAHPAREMDWISDAVSFVDRRLGASASKFSKISWIISDKSNMEGLLAAILMIAIITASLVVRKWLSHVLPSRHP
ncbi:hypothetical protein [Sphingobium sp. CR28]|uniref:hypothetical protein n=1 Tax=Sphingobium sp. CR28 TaxID=3400272 RepID=UPI003FF0B966